MAKNDGGPAYPQVRSEEGWPGEYGLGGMSLRDWFAGQAIVGLAGGPYEASEVAGWAYGLADAMIAARDA